MFTVDDSSSTPTEIGAVSQDSTGVPGENESYDQFGRSVALVAGGLCIGIPGEDTASATDAGRVVCGALGSNWTNFQPGGSAQTGAAVGTQLSRLAASSDSQGDAGGEYLLVAIPGANAGAITASGQIVGPNGQHVTDSVGPVANERYGVLATTWSAGPFYFIGG